MSLWLQFVDQLLESGSQPTAEYDRPGVGRFGAIEREYDALADGPAIVDRSYRGLLEITGSDRGPWLHNLTTNQVKPLSSGDGNYAFTLNLKGRILFDLNIMVRADSIWIDLDRRFLGIAMQHFDKYTIMEDVKVADRSDEWVRFGLVGSGTAELVSRFGVTTAANLPFLGMTDIRFSDVEVPLLRHDFCGPFALELFVPAEHAVECWRSLTDESQSPHAVPVGDDAVQVRRIEAGIPWSLREITDEYLPAETGLMEKAVSETKGCYLGQEVVERMRSRQVVARRLMGLEIAGSDCPKAPADLLNADAKVVGKLTSACHSPAKAGLIGLGYVKTASGAVGGRLGVSWEDGTTEGVLVDLPFSL
ncbi:MAG: folate-binding protein YgfZ [Planctomycetes bacterium]|nr:folate-binding protein YgfZ [Planctomycetota bacterium]